MRVPSPNVIAAAQASQRQFPVVPASISLAQWALESGWGSKYTGLNNPFGIKAVEGQAFTAVPTHEEVNGRFVPTVARFANYQSLEDAFTAHAALLAHHPQYAAFQKATVLQDKCHALTGVYATDEQYGQKLYSLILSEGFTKYDLAA